MGHSNVWNSHPKNYGPGSRTCRVLPPVLPKQCQGNWLHQEIKFLSQLEKHPNIVEYYGHKEEGGRISLYMEYIQPGLMKKYILESKREPAKRPSAEELLEDPFVKAQADVLKNTGLYKD
ncbi:hypothetical protein K1719_017734 [Acacia pycnantha]|nr:hypothetical protein K1719_017734 [Acacia pycnantha]